MGAVWLCARADVRQRWRSIAVLALLLAVAGGFALTAVVGAVRASTTWERFRETTRAPDAFVSIPSRRDAGVADELRALPGVTEATSFVYVPLAPPGVVEGGAFAAVDDRFGRSIYRARVLEGRRADPARADEITVNPAMAEAGRIRAGDRITFAEPAPGTFSVPLTVVGVTVGTLDVSQNAGFPGAYLTPAFLAEYGAELGEEIGHQNQFVRLAGGTAGVPAFRDAVAAHFGEGGGVLVGDSQEEDDSTRQALALQAWSLALVAAAATAATLIALGQALARHLAAGADEGTALGAMGMTRTQLTVRSLPTVWLVAGIGTALAIALAAAASRFVPTGLARRIEPDPGIGPAVPALAAGGFLLAALVAAAGAAAAWRAPRRRRRVPRVGRTIGLGVRPAMGIGVANATGSGTARARATTRSTIVASAVGVLGVTAAITFAASLDKLAATPRLFGWSFDALVGVGGEDPARVDAAADGMIRDPDVTQLSVAEVVFVTIGNENIETLVLDARKGGPIHPPIVTGRLPAGTGEIALGAGTMQSLGARIGSTVTAVGVDGPVVLTVVGRAVYPVLGDGDIDEAASMTPATAERLRREESRGRFVLLSVAPGADPVAVAARSTDLHVGEAVTPSPVTNLQLVRSAPWVLAAFLSVVALAAVAHALVLSIRAGRRELGVLRALGFVRRQVWLTVLWQATATVAIGLVIGLPLGLASGRWLWRAVAGRTGVLVEPVIAAAQIAVAVPVALVLANLVAAVLGRAATRAQPATVLRTE